MTALDRAQVLMDFIGGTDPHVARRIINELFDRVGLLATTPFLGRALEGKSDPTIRQMIFGRYRVTYQVRETVNDVVVLTVQHTRERALGPDEIEGIT